SSSFLAKILKPKSKTILILGGNDKGLPVDKLLHNIGVYAKAAILLPGTGSDKIEPELKKSSDIHFEKAEHLRAAVERALKLSKPGDNILFSPGFTSFGQFKNEFDRGEQ